MKWEMKEARYGDIVRVSLGSIYHYGIFVSEDEVIQFGLPPAPNRRAEDVEVLSAPVDDFLAGGFLEVGIAEGREKKRRKSPKETVAKAKERLGEKGYNIINNNCEHFANECAFGEKFSTMTQSLRMKLMSKPLVHVYIERFPFPVEGEEIFPPARAEETERCSNPEVRQQKYFVWKLLERALFRSLGLKIKELDIKRTDNGKWECKECFFSLSHSDNSVAVAVSRKPVGVDIEKFDESRFTRALAEKIATALESGELSSLKDEHRATGALWTKKEAIFKLSGDKVFVPKSIEVSEYKTATRTVKSKDADYFITVASADAEQAVFYSDNELEILN